MNFFHLRKIGNFPGFRVFDFGSYPEIENSENSEIPKFLKENKSFEIYVFSIRTKIEKSETPEISCFLK